MKMFISLILFSALCSAHIEQGVWKGVVSENADCFMDVGETSFMGDKPHPLNERIHIQIGQTTYSVKHPYLIDAQTGQVSFNHDVFEDVVPTATGAFALQIQMIHSESFEGPGSFSVMEHDWKTGFKEVVHCTNLKWVSP